MKNNMSVSVAMAVFNEEKYLEEALNSIISQIDVDFEIIIVDDQSTDATYEIARKFSLLHKNISLFKNQQKGKVHAFNFAVSKARGDWLCLFAGDDIMPAQSLKQRLQAVQAVERVKPIVGLSRLMTVSDLKSHHGHFVPKNKNLGGFTGSSYFMDREAVSLLFPVPQSLPNEDTWLETGISHFDFQLVHSGLVSNHWRIHANNSINTLLSFAEFNKKLTPRLAAYALFMKSNSESLTSESCERLRLKVECEEARKSGNIFRILMSGAPIIERLRALSYSNSAFYRIRQLAYGHLSGR